MQKKARQALRLVRTSIHFPSSYRPWPLCAGLLHESLGFRKYFIFRWGADIAAINIDESPFAARATVRLTADLDLGIWSHLLELGYERLQTDVIAFIAYADIVSHAASLLLPKTSNLRDSIGHIPKQRIKSINVLYLNSSGWRKMMDHSFFTTSIIGKRCSRSGTIDYT